MGKRLSKKQIKKRIAGKCYFCDCDDYALLDVHRIVPGEEGGKYTDFNSLVVCSLCHRKLHADRIKVLGRHFSTAGKYVVHYLDENGEEMWK
jgi:hypothetical protein